MGIKTHFTLDYLNQYLTQNNIKVPDGCDLVSIFQSCDLYDQNLDEVVNEDGTTGDGRLQYLEVSDFLSKLSKFGNEFVNAVRTCKIEVFKKQEQELLESSPKTTDEFYESESFEYVYAKLKQLGVKNIDTDKINTLLEKFDYDLDENQDSFLTPKEASVNIKYEDGDIFDAKTFLNKNKNGQPEKTHILDWIVNQYINTQN